MVQFNDWCNATQTNIGVHALRVLSSDPARINVGIGATAAIIPEHYAAEEQVSRILARLGKPAAAEFIRDYVDGVDGAPTASNVPRWMCCQNPSEGNRPWQKLSANSRA